MANVISWIFTHVDKVDSTQRVADEMARSGAPQGQVVLATEQVMGRGRFDRAWYSPAGGLYMSLVLRPTRKDKLGLLPLLGAFSVVDGITKTTGIRSLVRWPNDVTIADKKVAGVIAESRYSGANLSHVILGIGINCNFRSTALGALAESTTTLNDQTGTPVDIDGVRDAVLEPLESMYRDWEDGLAAKVFADRKDRFSTVGKKVEIDLLDRRGKVVCSAREVRSDGALVTVRENGTELVVRGEEIQRLREL